MKKSTPSVVEPVVETVETVEPVVETPDLFFKETLLRSKKFRNNADALKVLLKDNQPYTMEQVEEILDEFMKGQVK